MIAEAEEIVARLAGDEPAIVRERIADLVRRSPALSSRSLSEHLGGQVVLKAENLQRTGSFKLRGALNTLRARRPETGVVAASAGNHGQSLAYAARAQGLPCEVFMPEDAPVAKVTAVEAFGGVVTLTGRAVDDCLTAARDRAAATGARFVHPFDDPDVILGQSTLGLELLEDVPDLAAVVLPVGGGGLLSGVAGAVKAARPGVRIVGVQTEASPAFVHALGGTATPPARPGPSIADGIAVKRPGRLTLPLVERYADELLAVSDDDVADAMVWLMERSKLIVEGGGAVGVAAILSGRIAPASDGATAVVLSGGNVDPGLVAAIVARHESTAGRRLRLFTRIADRPGGLAALLALIAEHGGNILRAEHVREDASLHVLQTGVEVVLETRGPEHGARILAALRGAGYSTDALDSVGRP